MNPRPCDEVADLRRTMHHRQPMMDERLARVIGMIRAGVFGLPEAGPHTCPLFTSTRAVL